MLPGDMFRLYPKFFTAMAPLAPEWVWAVGVATTGATQIYFSATANWRVRRLVSLHACAVWAFIGTLYVVAEWRAPGAALAFSLSFANAWAFYRLRHWERVDAEGEARG